VAYNRLRITAQSTHESSRGLAGQREWAVTAHLRNRHETVRDVFSSLYVMSAAFPGSNRFTPGLKRRRPAEAIKERELKPKRPRVERKARDCRIRPSLALALSGGMVAQCEQLAALSRSAR